MPEDPRPTVRRKLSSDKPVYGTAPADDTPPLRSGWNRPSNPHVPLRPRDRPAAESPAPE